MDTSLETPTFLTEKFAVPRTDKVSDPTPVKMLLAVMLASGVVSWWVLGDIKRELAPLEDRGVVLARVNAPDGATLAYTDRYVRGVEKIAEDYPEFDRIFSTVGNPTVSQANVFFRAKPGGVGTGGQGGGHQHIKGGTGQVHGWVLRCQGRQVRCGCCGSAWPGLALSSGPDYGGCLVAH